MRQVQADSASAGPVAVDPWLAPADAPAVSVDLQTARFGALPGAATVADREAVDMRTARYGALPGTPDAQRRF